MTERSKIRNSLRQLPEKRLSFDLASLALLFFTVIATAFAAFYTSKQWAVAKDTYHVAIDQERRQLRAYVSAEAASVISGKSAPVNQFQWTLFPRWANRGNTPTRFLKSRIQCLELDLSTGNVVDRTPVYLSERDIPPTQATSAGS
jgi:hypothetical protein